MKKIEPRIDTFVNQQLCVKKVVAGANVNFEYDDEDNMIINSTDKEGSIVNRLNVKTNLDTTITHTDDVFTVENLTTEINSNPDTNVVGKIDLPIKGGNGVSVDVAEDNKSIVISSEAGSGVLIEAPSTATTGTITEEQLDLLLASDNTYIILNDEIYRLTDKQTELGFYVYVHAGRDNTQQVFNKALYVYIDTESAMYLTWNLVANVMQKKILQKTVTISASEWANNTVTKTVTDVTSTSLLIVAPDVASISAYTTADIKATAQGTDSVTFTCATTPTGDITINIAVAN